MMRWRVISRCVLLLETTLLCVSLHLSRLMRIESFCTYGMTFFNRYESNMNILENTGSFHCFQNYLEPLSFIDDFMSQPSHDMTINHSFKLLSSVAFGWFSCGNVWHFSPRQNRFLMIPVKVVVCFVTSSGIALMPTSLRFVVIIFQMLEHQQRNAIQVLCSLP